MKPASLTIKGLYSYQKETFIDFSNLTSSGLFGIFGAVGSGKSTILEAITFALYNETDRLNSRDSRSYNMMNLKSNDLLIDFIFTIGDNDDKYRFIVKAKRNKKTFEDTGTFERKAYTWMENDWQPITVNAATILNLSYENFKRTIIIPQGKFQEFLQLKETDRVQMLKEIFGLERFELSGKVSKLTKENDLRVSNLQGQMQSLPEQDEELLKLKDLQIVNLDKEVNELDNRLKKMHDEEKHLQNIKALFEDLTVKKLVFKSLELKEPGIDELDKQVKAFEKCEQLFKHPLAGRNSLRQDIVNFEAEEKELQKDKTTLNGKINTETEKANSLRIMYANKDLLLQRAAELEKIITIQSTQGEINSFSERIQKGEGLVTDEIAKVEAAKGQLEQIKTAISVAEQSLPDTAALVAMGNWFSKKSQLKTNYEKADNDLRDLEGKILNEKNKIEEAFQPLNTELNITSLPGNLFIVKEKVNHLEKEYDDKIQVLQEEQNHLKLYQKLDEFAKALTDDSECPLCGSVHHPNIFSAESISADAKQKQIAIKEFEQKKKTLNGTLISLSGLYANYETHLAQHDFKTKERSFFLADLEKHTDSFSFAGYTEQDEDLVTMQLSAIDQQNKEVAKLRTQRDDQEKLREEANNNALKYKEACDKLNTLKAQSEGQLNVLKTQIVLHDLSVEIIKEVNNLQIAAESLKSEHTAVTKEFEHAEKAIQENTQKLAVLTGTLEQLKKIIGAGYTQKKELDFQIEKLLLEEGFKTAEEVEVVLATKLDINKEKNTIEGFRRDLHALDTSLKEAIAKVEGKEYAEQVHETLNENIVTTSNEQVEKTKQLVTEIHELKELTAQMKARVELQKQLYKLDLRGENLKILSNLFRSSGFVNYVSSVYLQNLVNAANERFYKMTQQKLRLELSADNSFTVRDFMNNGALRSVKTLSGGQTFQAALSLALALADNIQHLTRSKQNFFFLDEGFGSLDKEALAIVFGTLKNLRLENRIVGVISHVEEMQQEIPVNLQIRNDADSGSYIKNSWD